MIFNKLNNLELLQTNTEFLFTLAQVGRVIIMFAQMLIHIILIKKPIAVELWYKHQHSKTNDMLKETLLQVGAFFTGTRHSETASNEMV